MVTIGFLHTAAVHESTFASLVDELGAGEVTSTAHVDEEALAFARRIGPDEPAVRHRIETGVTRLRGRGADVIVCTCSTIGGVAEDVGRDHGWNVVRVDRAMAERAVDVARPGGRIVVIAALASTVGPTGELLGGVVAERAPGSTITVDSVLVEGAWAHFERGDHDGYLAVISAAVRSADGDGADVIVLAQASMADVADRVATRGVVLSGPRLAVAAAISSSTGRAAPRR